MTPLASESRGSLIKDAKFQAHPSEYHLQDQQKSPKLAFKQAFQGLLHALRSGNYSVRPALEWGVFSCFPLALVKDHEEEAYIQHQLFGLATRVTVEGISRPLNEASTDYTENILK